MDKRTASDVDCSRLVPDCGFACPKCIEEIKVTLADVPGVSKAYIEAVRAKSRGSSSSIDQTRQLLG